MNHLTGSRAVCSKCHTELDKKQLTPENCDVNTRSLLLMFRLNEVVMAECPKCGSRRMLINNIAQR